MEGMTQPIIDALHAKFQAEKLKAQANLQNYFNNSVGVGEHPDIIAEADKLIEAISSANGKIDVLKGIVEFANQKAQTGVEGSDNR